jgi:SecD/SecF fusion protein
MSGKIIWKLALSALIVAWALLNLLPLSDTPFEEFLPTQVQAQQEEFDAVLAMAEARLASGESTTLYLALRDVAKDQKIDLQPFFPQLNARDIRNIDRRNEAILREVLRRSQSQLRRGLDLEGGVAVTLGIKPDSLNPDMPAESQLEQAISVISDRVNGLGVTEPSIRAREGNRIEIQMPGINTRDNPEVIDVIRAPALLEFRRVYRFGTPLDIPPDQVPPGYVILTEEREMDDGSIVDVPYYVRRIPDATGEIISNARPRMNEMGQFYVAMSFTDTGADMFENLTRIIAEENERFGGSPGQLAIVLDGKLQSAPTVRARIPGRNGAIIEGRFSQREAVELSNVLNNPLQVELVVESLTEVGPTLAEDARTSSINAAMLGAGLVILFMLFYYRVGGLVSVVSVGLNLIIVLGILSSLGATLTLPGVAALVLTIGMAVDANILIFERMREELKIGKSLPHALQAGYEKAFSTIVDANLTTLITAGILIWLGTGPVKGFGVTLAIGIGATLFTALIFNRAILEFLIDYKWVKRLLTFTLFRDTTIPFLNYARPAFIASWILVAVGVFTVYQKGDDVLGIDFTGGTEIRVSFNPDNRVPIGDIIAIAAANNLGEVQPYYVSNIGETAEFLTIQMEEDEGLPNALIAALSEAHPGAELQIVGEERIGASVSDHITRNAFISVAVALIGILLYVAVRFEFGFGIGALVATIHDILMTVGIYVLLGGQFSAPMVAAILMIVGYSINDTIVVFDRIREELQLNPLMKLRDVVHLAINRTLSRTVLTSGTTLLASFALYFYATGIISDFALIFIIGIITGTFSSIFIASPVFFWWHKGDRKHVEEREITPKYEWEASARG